MIKVGDKIPANLSLYVMDSGKPNKLSTEALFKSKRTVLFAVPGAFTPTCSELHLPGYLSCLYDFREKGVNQVACVSVNDVFVMNAWAKANNIVDEITMLADGNADFTKALGLEIDMSKFGLGLRSIRYAMVIDDMVVTMLKAEQGGELNVSKAEVVLEAL